jgi:hypothetical protein
MLLLFICADAVFIIVHMIKVPLINAGLIDSSLMNTLSIVNDSSFADVFQYLKYFWVMILLALLSLKVKSIYFIPWVLLFLYFLLDDMLQIHETFGRVIGANFEPMLGLRGVDFGELVVSAIAGSVIFSSIAIAFWKGNQFFRAFSLDMLFLVGVLVAFGVGLDILHSAVHSFFPTFSDILGTIEDGGEMVSMSLLVWYTFLHTAKESNDDLFILHGNHLTQFFRR